MNLARIAVVAAAGIAAVAFAGVFQPSGAHGQAGDETSSRITAFGNGSANITPDRASFAFGTVSQARTAATALAASSQAVERVISALRNVGIARADIQTAEVSLSPRMNDSGEAIVGYTASNTVTAVIRRLGDAGTVIDAAVGAGANQVSGPNLLASDQDAADRNALRAAVANARGRAETLASAAGLTLGRIIAISEGSGPMPLPAGGTRETAVPIEPGTQKIEAMVSLTFAVG